MHHQYAVDSYVFNGDADGLCALQQLRLQDSKKDLSARPQLITGVKRDIQLLEKIVDSRNASITVLDLSLDQNRVALQQLLNQQNHIVYIDHHYAGEIPASSLLQTYIDPSPDTCTALLVDKLLKGQHAAWALTGAFGDNLLNQAGVRARARGLSYSACEQLQRLGTLLNYNSYGETTADLHVHPAALTLDMVPYADPLQYMEHSSLIPQIQNGYQEDLQNMQSCQPYESYLGSRVFLLPDAPWARRISGIFANLCAGEQPGSAHAILQERCDGSLRISVRAPQEKPVGADSLCRQFAGGGGRAAAAGINRLPAEELDQFLTLFRTHFSASRLF